MYGTRHTRDYGESVPDIWRQAINTLKPFEIERGLRRLTSGGSGSPPTLPQFMKACRMIGDDDSGAVNPSRANMLPVMFDPFHMHGQKCLSAFIQNTKTKISEEQLQAMIVEKNKIVSQYKDIATADEVTGAEIRDTLFRAFGRACA